MENAEFQHPDQPADILASLQAGLIAIQRKLDNRSTPEPDFKSQGNKEQFQHGVKVVAKLDQATEAINAGDPVSVQTAILEAKAEIVKRQKLIKIADRSPQGWQTVKEYVQDDLFESPEDEKRLKKAEKSAAEKQAEASARRSKASAAQIKRLIMVVFAVTGQHQPLLHPPTRHPVTPWTTASVSSAASPAMSVHHAPPYVQSASSSSTEASRPYQDSIPDNIQDPGCRNWEISSTCRLPTGVKGVWDELSASLRDPSLRRLATVDLHLLMSARASSTNKKYIAAWRRWELWADSKSDITVFPVDPFQFSLYLSSLAASGPKSSAESAAAAVSWVHGLAGMVSPTSDPMVKNALMGFKRIKSTAVIRKEPITADILSELLIMHGHPNATLADLRVVFICFVSYAGFLRFNDLRGVARKDCVLSPECMTVHLSRSKLDQFRQGADVTIARTFKATCPVVAAERYFSALGDQPDSSLPVLRRLTATKSGLIPSIHPLSYTRTREIVLHALKPLVPDISVYGLHSLRSGGASAAFNANVSPVLISKQGRWKTDKARNAYLKLSSSTSMLASRSLGI